MAKTYSEVVDFLFTQLPMFQRIGAAAYKADLSTTISLNNILGNLQTKYPAVHIAGTNGKGSVSHFTASVLQENGFKVGLFTSPHFKDFTERIKINGKPISEDKVVEFVEQNMQIFSSIKPSFFEWTFALATWYFYEQKVDIAVFETGMGGRLDSTNTINPVITCITNVGLDHTQFLGNTVSLIAAEKAGIIKENIPVVVGSLEDEALDVISRKAIQQNSKLYNSEVLFKEKYHNLISDEDKRRLQVKLISTETNKEFEVESPFIGTYQISNIKTVLSIFYALQQNGIINIDDATVVKGINNCNKNIPLLGRWQIMQTQPTVIADVAHNINGITQVVEQLKSYDYDKLHIVLGMANDKDINGMLSLLPKEAEYYFCKADVPRGLDANLLKQQAQAHHLHGETYSSCNVALQKAINSANITDLVLVTGSVFVVAEII
ncbi:MAG: bifunctional folylpolyglutamate synthase/dihydrofolate synthase [Bacteroidales bacterium]